MEQEKVDEKGAGGESVSNRLLGFAAPTRKEIVKAREQISDLCVDKYPLVRVMDCWKGEDWHHSEVLYGILVGLQVAKNRAAKEEA